jgi:hypothetical protein
MVSKGISNDPAQMDCGRLIPFDFDRAREKVPPAA